MTEISITTEQEWDEVISSTTGPVLLLVTAPTWCIPCRRFEPHWNKAQETEALEHYTFVKVDAGADPSETVSHWASVRFDVLSVPTLLAFEGGEIRRVEARAVVPLIKELNA